MTVQQVRGGGTSKLVDVIFGLDPDKAKCAPHLENKSCARPDLEMCEIIFRSRVVKCGGSRCVYARAGRWLFFGNLGGED
jgi:hypothetical protein